MRTGHHCLAFSDARSFRGTAGRTELREGVEQPGRRLSVAALAQSRGTTNDRSCMARATPRVEGRCSMVDIRRLLSGTYQSLEACAAGPGRRPVGQRRASDWEPRPIAEGHRQRPHAKPELMGCMMGFAIDTPESRMNKGDSEDTASARPTFHVVARHPADHCATRMDAGSRQIGRAHV